MSLHQISSLNESIQLTHEWLKDVEMGLEITDREKAYQVTRAVLHALRDRLTVEEATDLAAQLPLVLKGVFFDGYNPSGKPEKYSTKEEFLERVERQVRGNFGEIDSALAATVVFGVLESRISGGEIDDVLSNLPHEIRDLLE